MPSRVLIVDDSITFSEFLEASIRAAGHETATAHDGRGALECLDAVRPDLVFLDLLLPGRDGFKICEEIRTRVDRDACRVVLMSGIYRGARYKSLAFDTAGADAFLAKPFSIADVWRVLEEHLPPDEGPEIRMWRPPAPPPPEEVLRGTSFRDRPLAMVLADLYRARLTGLLFVKGRETADVLCIERGRLVFVRSNDESERLDRFLCRRGLLTDEQAREAGRLLEESRGRSRVGEILIGMGHLSRREIEDAIQEQMIERVLRAFRSEELAFRFVEGDSLKEDVELALDTPALILAGIREMPEKTDFRRLLPAEGAIPKIAEGANELAESVELSAEELGVLERVDACRSLEEIVAAGAGDDDARHLFLLHCLGVLAWDKPPGSIGARNGSGVGAEPREEPELGIPESGSLQETTLPRILALAREKQWSGVVGHREGSLQRWIILERGEVLGAGSECRNERIEEILVELGLFEACEVEDASREMDAAGDGFSTRALIERGRLTREQAGWASLLQTQRIVGRCLDAGTCSYRVGSVDPSIDPLHAAAREGADLVQEAMEAAFADPDVPTRLRRTRRAETLAGELALEGRERSLLKALGREMTLGELAEGTGIAGSSLARGLRHLACLGLIDLGPDESGLVGDEAAVAAVELADDVPPPSVDPADQGSARVVPRFLYEALLCDRERLEAALFLSCETLAALRDRLEELETSEVSGTETSEPEEGLHARIRAMGQSVRKAIRGVADLRSGEGGEQA